MVTVSAGKHRRFEEEPLGAPEYFRAPPGVAGPAAGGSGAWGPAPAAAIGPQSGQLAGYPGSNGYPASPVPDWPPDSLGNSWPQWGGPPPALHPDHPSAPVPRVRVPQAPAQAGPVRPGRTAPGAPSGPPAGPARLPRRRPAGPGPSGSPNAGPRFNGAGPRAGGPGPANPAQNMPRAQQDFNTGDIYNSGQFPPAPARTCHPSRAAGYPPRSAGHQARKVDHSAGHISRSAGARRAENVCAPRHPGHGGHHHRNCSDSAARWPLLHLPGERGGRVGDRSHRRPVPGPSRRSGAAQARQVKSQTNKPAKPAQAGLC